MAIKKIGENGDIKFESAEKYTECNLGGPLWLRQHPNKNVAQILFLRLCKPCATTCQVHKQCMPRATRITHLQYQIGNQGTLTMPLPAEADLRKHALALQTKGAEPLCGNF